MHAIKHDVVVIGLVQVLNYALITYAAPWFADAYSTGLHVPNDDYNMLDVMHSTGSGESPEKPALRVWVGAGWFDGRLR